MKNSFRVVFAILGGFVGGWLSLSLLEVQDLHASQQQLTLNELQLVDSEGRPYVELTQQKGEASTLSFLNKKGNPLLKMGLDSKGIPYIQLMSDKSGQPVVKTNIALEGTNQSAMLIFKDNKGRDRLVMGLDPEHPNQEPFFTHVNKNQKKTTLFGTYPRE